MDVDECVYFGRCSRGLLVFRGRSRMCMSVCIFRRRGVIFGRMVGVVVGKDLFESRSEWFLDIGNGIVILSKLGVDKSLCNVS